VPDELLEALRVVVRREVVGQELIRRYVEPDVQALEREVPVVWLKGPALGHTAYEAPHLRVYRDIDLLVRRDEVERAARTLVSIGYRCRWTSVPHLSMHGPVFEREVAERSLTAYVELHTHVAPCTLYRVPPPDRLWTAATPARVWGRERLVLAPEHAYLQSAIQVIRAVSAGTLCLRRIVDCKELRRSGLLDGARLRAEAAECGCRGLVGFLRDCERPDSLVLPEALSPATRRLLPVLNDLLAGTRRTRARLRAWFAILHTFDRRRDRWRHVFCRAGAKMGHLVRKRAQATW